MTSKYIRTVPYVDALLTYTSVKDYDVSLYGFSVFGDSQIVTWESGSRAAREQLASMRINRQSNTILESS